MAQVLRVRIPHSGELGIAGFRGRIPRATLASATSGMHGPDPRSPDTTGGGFALEP